MNATEAMKAVIRKDGRSLMALESETGVSIAVLSRFMRNQRSITTRTADRIIDGLGLTVKVSKAKK